MIVMPSNATGIRMGYLARKYENAPARLGHLFSPGGETGPHAFMPYALDNGAYGCWQRGEGFDIMAWMELLDWASSSGQAPIWCLVPDVVGDAAGTLYAWSLSAPVAAKRGWPLAFAAQDGMTPRDVPADAAVVFMGGSTEWKWSSLGEWAAAFPGRLHVGRVNGLRQLRLCADVGAASCDGTGFSRTARQMAELETFLAEMAGERRRDDQRSLSFDDSNVATAHGLKSCTITETAATGEGN